VVDDCRVVEAQLAAVCAQDPVWLLWLLGRLEPAVGEWRLRSSPASLQVLRLAARVYRCGGLNRARRLRAEALALAGTLARLASISQHMGGRVCDQHRYTAAWAELVTALAIRTRAGTDPGPAASSAMAARPARALASRT